jgi:hypothetical protein
MRRETYCVYCGGNENLSKDHIPPKNLFSKPRPNDLITVPSCKKCNQEHSKDDNYFRDMLVMRHDLSEHPLIQNLIKPVLRSFKRKESERYFWSIYSRFGEHHARTRHGIYVGKQPTLQVDLGRVLKVVQRIVKGLHYHENGRRLSSDYVVDTFTSEYVNYTLTHTQRELFLKTVILPTLQIPPKSIGNGVFKYKQNHSNDPDCSLWLFLFFDKVFFASLTLPKGRISRPEKIKSSYPPGFYE